MEVARTLIQFKKDKSEYYIILHVQGFEFGGDTYTPVSDKIVLCSIPEDKLEENIKYYSLWNHDIEVSE